MLTKYDQGGVLPKWELVANYTGTMIGYHSVPVIVDAYFKGIKDFDVEKAIPLLREVYSIDEDCVVFGCYSRLTPWKDMSLS